MRGAMRVLSVALALAVAACGQAVLVPPDENADAGSLPGGAVTVTSITSEARPGGVVQVRFQNSGPNHYWYNPCQRLVERQEGDTWVELPQELRICTMQAHDLTAGSTRLESTDVPADATTGTYRFVFRVTSDHAGSRPVSVRSTPFTVR